MKKITLIIVVLNILIWVYGIIQFVDFYNTYYKTESGSFISIVLYFFPYCIITLITYLAITIFRKGEGN